MPADSSASANTRPAGPTNGLPSRSSRSPGCSPTSIIRAETGPRENTTCVASCQSSQPWHSAAASVNLRMPGCPLPGRSGTHRSAPGRSTSAMLSPAFARECTRGHPALRQWIIQIRRLAFLYMGVRKIRKFSVLAVAVMACGLLASCGAAPVASESSAPSVPEHATLQTLVDMESESTTLELGEQVEKNDAFTTTAVTYDSGKETVTGALSVPASDGPHPAIVLVHGVVDPDVYEPGSGLLREQVYFARAGYIVLSTDLRNSTAAPDSAEALGVDLGSTLDAINAVRALRASGLTSLDDDRVAILGHSLGGLLTLNTIVTQPNLVD